jgi:prolyl-tRNA synthetase
VRWTRAFVPTLREDPADVEAASHRLLVRGGFVRQLMAGAYSLLPLGVRSSAKVERIVRQEMTKIGAQEFSLPALQPAELWQRSGRWAAVDEVMFRLRDRHQAELCLGFTHEEVFTSLARELRSYKELPQIWYQFQTKFRDEERPKSGLLRVREFVMKDSYSFDASPAGLDRAFQQHFDAYRKIFERCGLDTLAVEASSGAMGGSESVEFMVETDAGEDWIAACAACGYAANVEKATSALPAVADEPGPATPEEFATPGVRTIADLAAFPGGAPAERQIKTLVYAIDGELVLVLLRGDHELAVQKLADGTGARELRAARADEIRSALGAGAGSLGAVGVRGRRILADPALSGRTNLTTGANRDDFHVRGVDVARDISVSGWLPLRVVKAGEPCPLCEAPLEVKKTVEVGHIFKLGTMYSEALGASVLDESGKAVPIIMGSYGIGIGRLLAAIVERNRDDKGIIWPVNVAPFELVIAVLNPKDVATSEAGERLYEELTKAGIDVILDDRDERPGVKFTDAELIGIPWRLTVGPKGLAGGKVELARRKDGRKRELDVDKAAEAVIETILEERR